MNVFRGYILTGRLVQNSSELFCHINKENKDIPYFFERRKSVFVLYEPQHNFFYEKNKSLLILRNVFEWFLSIFEVIYPDQLISDTALLDNFENLKKYADFLKKFNTGIVDIRQVEISEDKVKSNLFVRDRTNIDLQMNLVRTNNIIGKQKRE